MECANLKPSPAQVEVEVFIPEPRFDISLRGENIMNGQAQQAAIAMATKDGLLTLWSHTDPQLEVFSTLLADIQANFTTLSQPVDQFKTRYCPYVMEATIDVLGLSIINLPADNPPGTCAGDEISGHEYKHFEVNKYLLEQAVQKLRRDIPRIIRDLEMEGHVPEAEAQARMDAMNIALHDAVKSYLTEEVARRMIDMNKQTDSAEEFGRLAQMADICAIKDAMARGDKVEAMRLMKSFKEKQGGTPAANQP